MQLISDFRLLHHIPSSSSCILNTIHVCFLCELKFDLNHDDQKKLNHILLCIKCKKIDINSVIEMLFINSNAPNSEMIDLTSNDDDCSEVIIVDDYKSFQSPIKTSLINTCKAQVNAFSILMKSSRKLSHSTSSPDKNSTLSITSPSSSSSSKRKPTGDFSTHSSSSSDSLNKKSKSKVEYDISTTTAKDDSCSETMSWSVDDSLLHFESPSITTATTDPETDTNTNTANTSSTLSLSSSSSSSHKIHSPPYPPPDLSLNYTSNNSSSNTVTNSSDKSISNKDPSYVPKYKLIHNPTCPNAMPIVIDGFKYASCTLSDTSILTHFHSDHYVGLTKNFDAGKYTVYIIYIFYSYNTHTHIYVYIPLSI